MMSKRCPEIIIISKKSDVESLRLLCFPATLDPLKPAMDVVVPEYGMWNMELIHVLIGKSSGPVFLHDEETIEIKWTKRVNGAKKHEYTHWLCPGTDKGLISLRLREVKPEGSNNFFEQTYLVFPVEIAPGDEINSKDQYFRGSRSATDQYTEKIDAGFEVCIDQTPYSCFRITSAQHAVPNRKVETYINEETGLAVIQRLLVKHSEAPNSHLDSMINAPSESHIAKLPDEDGFVCLVCRIPLYRAD